jgi:hypothetical protein
MAFVLVVTQPFADYAKGDRITDADTIDKVLVHNHHHVVKVSAPDAQSAPDEAPPFKV